MAVIPNTDVNVQDIGQVLNSAGGSVNVNQPLTYFTASAKINKWAKYKPVVFSQDFPDRSSEWWKADDGWCGFNPVTTTSHINLVKNYKSNSNTWDYKLIPQGKPYRLGDFAGYYTDAQPFLASEITKGYSKKFNREYDSDTIYIQHNSVSDYEITLHDLKTKISSTGQIYLVAYVYNTNPLDLTTDAAISNARVGTYSTLIDTNSDAVGVTIPFSLLCDYSGIFYVVLGLSINGDTETSALPIPFDDDNYFMIRYEVYTPTQIPFNFSLYRIGAISPSGMSYTALKTLEAWDDYGTPVPLTTNRYGIFQQEFRIYNYNSSAATFNPSEYYFQMGNYDTGKKFDGTVRKVNGSTSWASNGVSVPANSSITVEVGYGDGYSRYELFTSQQVGDTVMIYNYVTRNGEMNQLPGINISLSEA